MVLLDFALAASAAVKAVPNLAATFYAGRKLSGVLAHAPSFITLFSCRRLDLASVMRFIRCSSVSFSFFFLGVQS